MNSKNSATITLSEAKSALLKSGYLLENRVEQFLQEQGYYVEANTGYPDPITQKSREIDLQATKDHYYKGKLGNWVTSTLFIECVNNPQPIAFITKEISSSQLLHENIKLNGLPTKVKFSDSRPSNRKNDDIWISVEDFLGMQEYHHYCSEKVATQFCSFMQKKGSKDTSEWMATHDDTHFESFQKLGDIMSYYSTKTAKDWEYGLKTVKLQFFYLVVVLQGEILDVKVNKRRGINFKNSKHIQFLRTTIQNNEKATYQIDVVTESHLPKFLEIVEKEMLITMDRIKENLDAINEAIHDITTINF